jgi:serine/threonine protein kinase
LGVGSFGGAYLVTDDIGRKRTLKVIKMTKKNKRTIVLEIMTYARLDHSCDEGRKHACLRNFGCDGVNAFLVLDFIPGETMRKYFSKKRSHEFTYASDFLLMLANAAGSVASLHAKGVHHLDLRIDNFVMNGPLQPVVIDMGLSCIGDKAAKDPDGYGKWCALRAPRPDKNLDPRFFPDGLTAEDTETADIYGLSRVFLDLLRRQRTADWARKPGGEREWVLRLVDLMAGEVQKRPSVQLIEETLLRRSALVLESEKSVRPARRRGRGRGDGGVDHPKAPPHQQLQRRDTFDERIDAKTQ